jgi:tetratricopeptide (TPR) repeat protein
LLENHISELREQVPAHNLAPLRNMLGMTFYCRSDLSRAKEHYNSVAGRHALSAFPEDQSVAYSMLGRIAAKQGENEEALECFQSAIDVAKGFRTIPGKYRVERSNAYRELGCFHLNQGNWPEAREAFAEAVRLRRETGTATHPNCADAIRGLSDVSVAEGALTSATLQAKESLAILDTALVPTHPRIAPTLVALASIERLAGHPDAAGPLETRVESLLEKPLGPWKDDFLDTTAFYAERLRAAGQSAPAARLDAWNQQQKVRP